MYKYKTWYEAIFKQKNVIVDVFMVLFSVAFLALSANIRIPLWPVPITMQTFGIFCIAFFFGSKKGLISILTYIAAGIVGIGVFAGNKSGIAAIIGPTGGYLIGFAIAAFAVGLLVEKGFGRTKKSVLLTLAIGNIIIYISGLIGLAILFPKSGFLALLSMGVFPFLIGDAIKIIAAVGVFPFLWKGSFQ